MQNSLNSFAVLDERKIILDFDGVMTNLTVDWDALRDELVTVFNIKGKQNLSNIYLYAQVLHRKDQYLKIVSDYELREMADTTISPLVKYIVSNVNNKFDIFSSNTLKTITTFIDQNNLSEFADKIISADDVQYLKPNSEGLRKIIGTTKKKDYLFIGNSLTDEIAAGLEDVNFLMYSYEEGI